MMITRNNLYNPYTNSFLGVFVNNDLDSIDTKTELILEDIDLYFQPVPEPVTASIFLDFGYMDHALSASSTHQHVK